MNNEGLHTQPTRLLHTMLRVADLERSLAFYTGPLGMRLHRQERYPDGRFTLAFVGYGQEKTDASIELTHNWDETAYQQGTAYGHIALAVHSVAHSCARLQAAGVKVVRKAGPMQSRSPDRSAPEHIAFIEDPDGYRIELIQQP
ncbi:MAG: lactoylglutathione lyase [Gammaproteobacteria bacterium]|nr:lactoylglutathione lyase [Gammaproteobacteria bacterium]MBU0827001.1 lactoylglutathione lyase [Gammaproteobacteria bacterium]MBU0893145.1 lactoylglutathione lyase [Gammaproteobacteria bacterium]MBU1354699.1 lactoylglutathione lyase [Gammaproteobacteria bacterium]MBU1506562.1 lactoylglutathione lyase [Gammaproteobacteria bacterium]